MFGDYDYDGSLSIRHHRSGTTCYADECVHFNGSFPHQGLGRSWEAFEIITNTKRYEAFRTDYMSRSSFSVYETPRSGIMLERSQHIADVSIDEHQYKIDCNDLGIECIWRVRHLTNIRNWNTEDAEITRICADYSVENKNLTLDAALCLCIALYEHIQMVQRAEEAAAILVREF